MKTRQLKIMPITILTMLFFILTSSVYARDTKDSRERLSFYKDNYLITGYPHKIIDSQDKKNQVKYQVSVQYLLDLNIGSWLTSDFFNMYFIYTQKHFWNVYDSSAPFKDINFSPAFMFNFNTGREYFYKIDIIPLLHESNGEVEEKDRSWNRFYTSFGIVQRKYFAFDTAFWYIYPLNMAKNNNDIHKYTGYGELTVSLSNNILDPTVKAEYTLRAWNERFTHIVNLKLSTARFISDTLYNNSVIFVQFYHGFAEDLLDYNMQVTRIRAGIALVPD